MKVLYSSFICLAIIQIYICTTHFSILFTGTCDQQFRGNDIFCFIFHSHDGGDSNYSVRVNKADSTSIDFSADTDKKFLTYLPFFDSNYRDANGLVKCFIHISNSKYRYIPLPSINDCYEWFGPNNDFETDTFIILPYETGMTVNDYCLPSTDLLTTLSTDKSTFCSSFEYR